MAKMYKVYSIVERPKEGNYWLNIGLAVPHNDGKGFNLRLEALPLHGNGKIVLREDEPNAHVKVHAAEVADRKSAAVRSARGRILPGGFLRDAPGWP